MLFSWVHQVFYRNTAGAVERHGCQHGIASAIAWIAEQFLQSEAQETRSTRFVDAVQDVQRSKSYGIPNSSRCRGRDGALRDDHRRLPETAGMVTAKGRDDCDNRRLSANAIFGKQKTINARFPLTDTIVLDVAGVIR